jgi:hypothetical protein
MRQSLGSFILDTYGIGNWVTAPDNNGHWFDGCDHDFILFDDVEAGAIPTTSQFKRLTDRYPIKVPFKGGFITWKPRVIVFTSNSHPKQWWPELSDFNLAAIERRITSIEGEGEVWEGDGVEQRRCRASGGERGRWRVCGAGEGERRRARSACGRSGGLCVCVCVCVCACVCVCVCVCVDIC